MIPDLVRRHPPDRPLRIWVAGCSTGEETYSLAMLLLEEIAAAKRSVRLQVFASDVDGDAVALAREGLYPESIAADVSPARLARFFTKEDHGYRVVPELRGVVVFTVPGCLGRSAVLAPRPDLLSQSAHLSAPGSAGEGSSAVPFRPQRGRHPGARRLRDGGQCRRPVRADLQDAADLSAYRPQLDRGEVDFPIGTGEGASAIGRGRRTGLPARCISATRTDAAGAGRDLCAGFGSDQSQGRVPLLLGTDRSLFAGGGGRTQPRPAGHGARRVAQQARAAIQQAAEEHARATVSGCAR